MNLRLVFGLFVFLLAAILLTAPFADSGAYSSAFITVDPGQSIQEAINNAEPGSTILVMNGIYKEQIVINKALTLIGNGNSTIIQNIGSGNTISIPSGVMGASLSDFLVNGTGRYSTGIFIKGMNNSVQNVAVINHEIGVHIYDSSRDVLENTRLTNNTYNLRVYGLTLSHFLHNIDSSNLVQGKRVYYWVSEHGRIFPSDAGYVAAINCSRVIVKDLRLSNNFAGVQFAYTNSSLIQNVTCQGNEQGIRLLCSNDNTISDSTLRLNSFSGISLSTASDNHITGNLVELNPNGISLSYSSLIPAFSENNTISGNVIANNRETGIYVVNSSYGKVYDNEIVSNPVGIEIDLSEGLSKNNSIYHNNLLNNTVNAHFAGHPSSPLPTNNWDDGYPNGGNHWGDYNGTDVHSGPFQNQTGTDGIGDAQYAVGENNKDSYPLIRPYGSIRNTNTALAYLTIQSAINAHETLNGHTIAVRNGVYRESIIINKALALIGQNRDNTILEMEPEANVTTIVVNNVTLSSFTIRSSHNVAPSIGVSLVNASHCTIRDIFVTGKFVAIKLDRGSCNNLIQNNLLRDNQYGIFLRRRPTEGMVSGNVVFNNTIVHNFWNGIELARCEGNVIEANTLADNGGFGLEMPYYTPSYNNIIFHNNFINNSWNNVPARQAYDVPAFSNRWDYDGEGNFWSDYAGRDSNQDGIGDVPYSIMSGEEMKVEDQYPLMGKFYCFKVSNNSVSIVSDTTIDRIDFSYYDTMGELTLNMTKGTPNGFLRLRISRVLLDNLYQVQFSGETTSLSFHELSCSNQTFRCLYVSYTSNGTGKHLLTITGTTQIPEYSVACLLVIFSVTAFLACMNRFRTSRLLRWFSRLDRRRA